MRLTFLAPVAVLCLCALVLAIAWRGRASAPSVAHTGMALLRAYPCRRNETKTVLVKGVEDGFSPAGNEPGFLRPGLDNAHWRSVGAGRYDQSQPDHFFIDSLQAPARIHQGLFVIGLQPLASNDSDNDLLAIGDLATTHRFSHPINDLSRLPGWQHEGTLYSAPLDRIVLAAAGHDGPRSLLDWLRENAHGDWLDVLVEDDTSVDFIAVAACVEPPRGKGATLMSDALQPPTGMMALTCRYGPPDWPICDPYLGDTPCGAELPVACLLPGRQPLPAGVTPGRFATGWTGGEIALTEPVPASRFHRIGDVDAFCAAHFGSAWRTLTGHEGLPNISVTARGRSRSTPVRVWVDEVNQPYATCWGR